jgi:hypothetical protein
MRWTMPELLALPREYYDELIEVAREEARQAELDRNR